MKFDWEKHIGRTLNVTMHENYGVTSDPNTNSPIYEIVFKAGKLIQAYDDSILLETEREGTTINVFIPHQSIKCVEIFSI